MITLLRSVLFIFIGFNIIQRARLARQYQQYYSDSFNYYQKRTRRESSEGKDPWKRASKAFKINVEKLKRMTKSEIKRAYLRRSMKVHPDTTGKSSKKFVKLKDAFDFVYGAAPA